MANAGNSSVSHWLAVFARHRGLRYYCSMRNSAGRGRAPRAAERVFVENEEYQIGGGISAFFDAVGGRSAKRGVDALGTGGTFVAYGRFSNEPFPMSTDALIYRGIRMEGFGFQAWYQQQPRERIIRLLREAAELSRSEVFNLEQSPISTMDEFQKALERRERIVFSFET